MKIEQIEPCAYGHIFRMKQDSEHYKKDDLVWSSDFTGATPLTVGGKPTDPAIIEISGYDETSASTRPEEVHIEMLEYVGKSKED